MSTATNYWPNTKCAKAFWSQQEVAPYRQLLADTMAWANPRPGDHWLDLGCGGGAITRAIWEKSAGQVAEVVGVDCAAVNASQYQYLRQTLTPAPYDGVRFVCLDFSQGLGHFADQSFDHAVSGLAISYAESYDEDTQSWTTKAYDLLLSEVSRVLRPGGRFVFSVNVPEPSWLKVSLLSLGAVFQSRPLRFLKKSLRMLQYGSWLKNQARCGRFHYLPAATIQTKLQDNGFHRVEHRLSFAGQAYIFRATRRSPLAA